MERWEKTLVDEWTRSNPSPSCCRGSRDKELGEVVEEVLEICLGVPDMETSFLTPEPRTPCRCRSPSPVQLRHPLMVDEEGRKVTHEHFDSSPRRVRSGVTHRGTDPSPGPPTVTV